jgi:repressor LexA
MADNKEIGKRIETRRKQLGLTLDDISSQISMARSTIQRYEKGNIEKIKVPVIEAIANVLKVSPAWLSCKTDEMESTAHIGTPYHPTHKIPILGCISAGLPIYAEQHIEGYIYTDLNGGNEYFGLRVHGDSMNAMNINEGNVLIVRRQSIVENGDIAVVLVNGECATVKRFYQSGNIVTLLPQSTNPEHSPQMYDLKKIDVNVLGKVVQNQIMFE